MVTAVIKFHIIVTDCNKLFVYFALRYRCRHSLNKENIDEKYLF
jgi:hypothetical protein